MKLTLKQQRFADEYIICGNATESAIKAGYSPKTAGTNADKLLKNTKIQEYIGQRLELLESEKIASQDEVLQYLTSIMRGEQTEQTLRGLGEGVQDITEIDVGAKDRIKAAELLGKRYGMWSDKVDITQRTVEITVGDWDAEE
ncbi:MULTISPECIES: terminase small subunit [unclassified Facklamia]|uniref:terminase small subunit n=1 Tax=Aerococcaceae TaxID=186827 RepID=UPI0013B8D442|nr:MULTISPECIES: terminase small subunit [unclassified Facklamia]NEW65280.1 terminase small subunit [Facklamia sp. 252]NEW68740.1 terminase small subunit [Facklamia sp. 253]QQD66129.1 terminase small subunit [Aerococcaceae bacterium zg-252]